MTSWRPRQLADREPSRQPPAVPLVFRLPWSPPYRLQRRQLLNFGRQHRDVVVSQVQNFQSGCARDLTSMADSPSASPRGGVCAGGRAAGRTQVEKVGRQRLDLVGAEVEEDQDGAAAKAARELLDLVAAGDQGAQLGQLVDLRGQLRQLVVEQVERLEFAKSRN